MDDPVEVVFDAAPQLSAATVRKAFLTPLALTPRRYAGRLRN